MAGASTVLETIPAKQRSAPWAHEVASAVTSAKESAARIARKAREEKMPNAMMQGGAALAGGVADGVIQGLYPVAFGLPSSAIAALALAAVGLSSETPELITGAAGLGACELSRRTQGALKSFFAARS